MEALHVLHEKRCIAFVLIFSREGMNENLL
jgi:hypothetical protein